MFFVISKLFWIIAAPSQIILWLVLATAVLFWRRRIRAAQKTAIAAAALLVVFGVLPAGFWLMRTLENSYTRPPWPERIDGVLVLGGGNNTRVLDSRGVPGADRALARLVGAFELSRRYPSARIVFSGGSGQIDDQSVSESTAAGRILTAMGLSPARLTLEGKSHNTWENFVFSQRLVKPAKGEIWLLATSAFHMPRAMAIARRTGWTMIPWPTDYHTTRYLRHNWYDVPGNLYTSDTAVREYLGILVYRLSGKSA